MKDSVRAESIQCFFCKHLDTESGEANTFVCAAFQSGIPEEIIQGIQTHNYVFPGQTGNFVFEEIEDNY